MAHGVSLELAKIPPHRYYNYQPIGSFRPAGPQVEKRERMAARAENRAHRDGLKPYGKKRLRERSMQAVSNA